MPLCSHVCSVGFVYILVLALFAGTKQSEAADYCVFDSGVKFCNYGCCTDKCCDISTFAIIGLVIGALIGLAALIGCIVCLACMCKQRANRDGNMVHPINNTNSVYVHNSASQPPPRHPPPSYGQYGQYGSNPGTTNTNYGFTDDAAYPPGYHPPPAYTYSNPRSDK